MSEKSSFYFLYHSENINLILIPICIDIRLGIMINIQFSYRTLFKSGITEGGNVIVGLSIVDF